MFSNFTCYRCNDAVESYPRSPNFLVCANKNAIIFCILRIDKYLVFYVCIYKNKIYLIINFSRFDWKIYSVVKKFCRLFSKK